MQRNRYFFYYWGIDVDNGDGTCMVAGFDVTTRKHKAIGRCGWNEPVVVVEQDEL